MAPSSSRSSSPHVVALNQARRSSSASAWRTLATIGLWRRWGSITGSRPPYDLTVSQTPRKWMSQGRCSASEAGHGGRSSWIGS